MTREADNPMTGCDFDWMVSNHAVWGWKAPVKASVSGVSLLQLSPFFASIFPLFPQKRQILRLVSAWKRVHEQHAKLDTASENELWATTFAARKRLVAVGLGSRNSGTSTSVLRAQYSPSNEMELLSLKPTFSTFSAHSTLPPWAPWTLDNVNILSKIKQLSNSDTCLGFFQWLFSFQFLFCQLYNGLLKNLNLSSEHLFLTRKYPKAISQSYRCGFRNANESLTNDKRPWASSEVARC